MNRILPGGELGFALGEVARLWRYTFERMLETCSVGLTPAEIRALVFAARYQGRTQSALAELMSIEPMTLSPTLERLEAFGLVVRSVNPDDRRARLVHITSAADAIFERIAPVAAAMHEEVTRDLDAEQRVALLSALATMRGTMLGIDSVSEALDPPPKQTCRAEPRSALIPSSSRPSGDSPITRILVVEDEPLIALDLCDLVEDLGLHMVGVAATAEQALVDAARTRPHIAIVNRMLDGRDSGLGLAARLCELHGTAVIMATASPDGVVPGVGGVAALVRKPFSHAVMHSEIMRLVGLGAQRERSSVSAVAEAN